MNFQELKSTDERKVYKLKPLSKQGVEAAIGKAEHYRLLNQPNLAESICLDILQVDPQNQKAQIILLLSLTDQFGRASSKAAKQALEIAGKLTDDYSRIYYTGIIHERQAASALSSSIPGSDFDACEWYIEAMECYEKADAIHPAGNDDAVLRWNTCARIIMQYNLKERPQDFSQPELE
jgi:replication-associated recombination protein RarA